MSATSLYEPVGKQLLDRQAGAMRSTWAERIEALGRHSVRYGLVLVAMTGWGQEEDRRRSKEAGFDHHLVKPADFRKVQEILETVPVAGT